MMYTSNMKKVAAKDTKRLKKQAWYDEKNYITLREESSSFDREANGLGFRSYYTGRVMPYKSSDEQFDSLDAEDELGF